MPFVRLENEIVNLSDIRRIVVKISAMEAPQAPLTHSVYIVGEYANASVVRLCKVGDIAGEKSDQAVQDAQVYIDSIWNKIKSEKSFAVVDALPKDADAVAASAGDDDWMPVFVEFKKQMQEEGYTPEYILKQMESETRGSGTVSFGKEEDKSEKTMSDTPVEETPASPSVDETPAASLSTASDKPETTPDAKPVPDGTESLTESQTKAGKK